MTSSMLVLREFEQLEVTLPDSAYALLRDRYAGRLDITHTERRGVYRLAARDYVGRIALPGGMLLVIQPKVPVSNLFYMLCYHAGPVHFYTPPVTLADTGDIFSIVICALVEQVEGLLRQGLYRSYIPREQDMPMVRGRIALDAQLRRYGQLRHRHICRYAELTTDTAENRVVAATLRCLPPLFESGGPEHLARRVRALLDRFEGVSVTGRGAALAELRSVTTHRLNAAYGPVLALCRLVLSGLAPGEAPGPHAFASFLVNMPGLFEGFLTAKLRALLPSHGLRVVAQRNDYLDTGRRVGIRPDVLVYPRTGGSPLLVLDAKYRRIEDATAGLNPDLYQLSAYLDRYGLTRGMLVYPGTHRHSNPESRAGNSTAVGHGDISTDIHEDMPVSGGEGTQAGVGTGMCTELRLAGTNKRLYLAKLDLGAPGPAQLERHCLTLAGQVAALALGSGLSMRPGHGALTDDG